MDRACLPGLQVVMAYMVGVAACLAAFYFTPASWPAVQWITVFFIGFFLYGPQMLIGLCGAELVRAPPARACMHAAPHAGLACMWGYMLRQYHLPRACMASVTFCSVQPGIWVSPNHPAYACQQMLAAAEAAHPCQTA